MKYQSKRHAYGVEEILHELKHFLPAQAPLKDFVHHNTLHAFQNLPFHQALKQAKIQFGFKGYLSLESYRELYRKGKIKGIILKKVMEDQIIGLSNFWIRIIRSFTLQKLESYVPIGKVSITSIWTKSSIHFSSGFYRPISIRGFPFGLFLSKQQAFWMQSERFKLKAFPPF
jgi:hypothetical protein